MLGDAIECSRACGDASKCTVGLRFYPINISAVKKECPRKCKILKDLKV